MTEIGRADLALHWSERGITETGGWQVGALYELACRTNQQLDRPLEVLRLRRAHHQRVPSATTYGALRRAAEALDAWPVERGAARAVLRDTDIRGYISVLLSDGDAQRAWDAATAADDVDGLGTELWLTLAASRTATDPKDAVTVYQRVADEVLRTTDRRAYQQAARILKLARVAAEAAGDLDDFHAHLARLHDTHRRRPTLIAILNKAKLTA